MPITQLSSLAVMTNAFSQAWLMYADIALCRTGAI